MKNVVNEEFIIGRVYQHELVEKTVKNEKSENYGKPFLSGKVEVAVDDEGMNVISVHYTYVTEKTKAGKNNQTYSNLKKIMEGKVWVTDGKDEAMKVKLSPTLALNDFYVNDDELISQVTNEGGFVEILNVLPENENDRTKFKVDFLITGINFVEADEERNIEEPFLQLRGAAFNFKEDLLPVTLIVRNPEGIQYFESFEPTPANPMFTQVWGRIKSLTKKEIKKDDTAFGEVSVTEVERKVKEWCITGVRSEPYEYGDDKVLTEADVTKAMQNREVMLAEKKRLKAEWEAQKNAAANTPSQPDGIGGSVNIPNGIPKGTFNF